MIMTIVEDFVKAILTELITWLIMIWIPALAAAAPSFGASTAAAGAATTARVASTGSRVSQIVAKLRTLLDKFLAFLRNLAGRLGNVRTAFQRSMVQKEVGSLFADMSKNLDDKSPLTKLWSKDGMLGERLQKGFVSSMGTAMSDTAVSQLGLGKNTNAGVDKPLRNISNYQKAGEYDDTGADQPLQETKDYLDI